MFWLFWASSDKYVTILKNTIQCVACDCAPEASAMLLLVLKFNHQWTE
jgi:hypothetical protein